MLLGQHLDRLAALKQLRAHMGQPDLFYIAAERLVGMRFENALQLARANLDALCHKLQRERLLIVVFNKLLRQLIAVVDHISGWKWLPCNGKIAPAHSQHNGNDRLLH